jgi:hypothetical protein
MIILLSVLRRAEPPCNKCESAEPIPRLLPRDSTTKGIDGVKPANKPLAGSARRFTECG